MTSNSPGSTFDPSQVRAAVFDIGGVFLYPAYRPVEALLPSVGIAPPADDAAYRSAHHAAVLALTTAVLASGDDPDETNAEFWPAYDHAYAASLGVATDDQEQVATAVRSAWDWAYEANIEAFHRLAATGLPVAIVSNNNGTAADQMRDHGVCQVGPGPLPTVAAIVDSGLEGVAKPDPAIFRPALDALAVSEPSTVLYVGDTVHADVHGARNAGMQVVQLDPFDHHASFDHTRLADLDRLTRALADAQP